MDPFHSLAINPRCDLIYSLGLSVSYISHFFSKIQPTESGTFVANLLVPQRCSHHLRLHTWRCVPTLYQPCSPARGTPRWPVLCPLHHRRLSPTCCCAAPQLALHSLPVDSFPPDAPWRLFSEWQCRPGVAQHQWGRRLTAGEAGGSSSTGSGSSWLHCRAIEVTVEKKWRVCSTVVKTHHFTNSGYVKLTGGIIWLTCQLGSQFRATGYISS